jgi:hypothetical protein
MRKNIELAGFRQFLIQQRFWTFRNTAVMAAKGTYRRKKNEDLGCGWHGEAVYIESFILNRGFNHEQCHILCIEINPRNNWR